MPTSRKPTQITVYAAVNTLGETMSLYYAEEHANSHAVAGGGYVAEMEVLTREHDWVWEHFNGGEEQEEEEETPDYGDQPDTDDAIIDGIIAAQGWTDDTVLDLLWGYVHAQGAPDAVLDHFRRAAEESV